jgi:hypothetical protein
MTCSHALSGSFTVELGLTCPAGQQLHQTSRSSDPSSQTRGAGTHLGRADGRHERTRDREARVEPYPLRVLLVGRVDAGAPKTGNAVVARRVEHGGAKHPELGVLGTLALRVRGCDRVLGLAVGHGDDEGRLDDAA